MKKIEQHRLNNNTSYLYKVWDTQKIRHNLHNWKLIISLMIDKVGLCDYYHKTITISAIFMMGYNCNYAKVKKALMHEIAHAITPGHNHNSVWKKTCGRIGGDTRLAMTMVMPHKNWAMLCRSCKWRNEYNTKPLSQGLVCASCKNSVYVKKI